MEWPTVGLILACHVVWIVGGMLWAAVPLLSVLLVAGAITFHSSLQHEVLHRHPSGNELFNEALISLPIGLFTPYRRYRLMHLRHHIDERLTDPHDDPESYYRAEFDWNRLPRVVRGLLTVNNSLAGRLILGPAISVAGFCAAEARRLASRGDKADRAEIRSAWAIHLAGVAAVFAIVVDIFDMPVIAYGAAAYLGASVLALRSFCEHQWSERTDQRTVIVEESRIGWLFLYNNLHLVHHKHPGRPWYELPSLYRNRRGEWQAMNGGYVFRGYGQIVRRYWLKPKEPVAHPRPISGAQVSGIDGNDQCN